jgi:hypothetical protein
VARELFKPPNLLLLDEATSDLDTASEQYIQSSIDALQGEDNLASELLRVCWRNPDGTYNCGRCEKCVRTMVQLLAADALRQCSVFERGLVPEIVEENENVRAQIRDKGFHYHQPIQVLRKTGRAPEVVEAIENALRGPSLPMRARSKVHDLYGYGRRFAGRMARRFGFR